MGRVDTGTFRGLQNISVAGMGGSSFQDAIEQSVNEIFGTINSDTFVREGGGADFSKSVLDNTVSLVQTTLSDMDLRPVGDHLAGRNLESELLSSKEKLLAYQNDEGNDAALRAATIPAIVEIEGKISRREFMSVVKDPEWGSDILELVERCAPYRLIHPTTNESGNTIYVTETVRIDLPTMRAEIDDYGEICCWVYSTVKIS